MHASCVFDNKLLYNLSFVYIIIVAMFMVTKGDEYIDEYESRMASSLPLDHNDNI